MITLESNLTLYPGLYYYLPLVKNKNTKAYSSIEEYSDTQAAKGTASTDNTQQTDNTNQVNNNAITDYTTLIETLKLELPESKIAILKMLPHSEVLQFLCLLDKDQLLSGLKLFTKDKLLQFVSYLPKEQLLKMLNKMYISKSHILENFSIKELNHFLSSKKIAKENILKIFQSLSKTELAQIAEASTGVSQGNKTQAQLLEVFKYMSTAQTTDGIKGLEYKKMRGIVSEMLKQDSSLYLEFSQNALFNQTIDFAKSNLIMGMEQLDNDQLIKYLDKLPDNLLALVATQIDTETLAQILIADYQNLLSAVMS